MSAVAEDSLTARVCELLRRHRHRHERLVDERAAHATLYPPPTQIEVAPVSPPLDEPFDRGRHVALPVRPQARSESRSAPVMTTGSGAPGSSFNDARPLSVDSRGARNEQVFANAENTG